MSGKEKGGEPGAAVGCERPEEHGREGNVAVCMPPFCFHLETGLHHLRSPVALPPSTVAWKPVRADTFLGVPSCPSEPRDCTGCCRMTDLSVLRCSQVSDLKKMLDIKTWALRFHLLAEM